MNHPIVRLVFLAYNLPISHLIRLAWFHSGALLCLDPSGFLHKTKGRDISFRENFNISFQAMSSLSTPVATVESSQAIVSPPAVLLRY